MEWGVEKGDYQDVLNKLFGLEVNIVMSCFIYAQTATACKFVFKVI